MMRLQRLLIAAVLMAWSVPALAQMTRLSIGTESRTVASNGGGTPATLTFTPLTSHVAITCNDPDGCAITMGETGLPGSTIGGRVASLKVTIVNLSTNAVTLADSAGVQELSAVVSLGQHESITLAYQTDRWVETARSNTAATVTTSTLCTLANWCETTGTIADAAIKALPTTGVTLVVAQGSGFRPRLLSATLVSSFAAGVYTNISAGAYAFIGYDGVEAGGLASAYLFDDAGASVTEFTDFFGSTTASTADFNPYQLAFEAWGNGAHVNASSFSNNLALKLKIGNSGGNLTGGNAANAIAFLVRWFKAAL